MMPEEATIAQILLQYLSSPDEEGGHWYYDRSTGEYVWQSYHALATVALAESCKLVETGVEKSDIVLVAMDKPKEILALFYGAMLIGALPVVLSLPSAFQEQEEWLKRIKLITNNKGSTFLITSSELKLELDTKIEHVLWGESVSCGNVIEDHIPTVDVDINGIAFLQLTSGTTGDGDILAVSHKNVHTNIRGLREAAKINSDDVGISWLPLYHDMGLVGAELFCFINGFKLVLMSPSDFLRSPAKWLQSIQDFQCTMAVTPTFGLEYCSTSLEEKNVQFDLSTLKSVFCGAEPIRSKVLRAFAEQFTRSNFSLESFFPCYGLAENTLTVTLRSRDVPIRKALLTHKSIPLNRTRMTFEVEELVFGGGDDYIEVVSLGKPINGTSISIVGEDNSPVESEGVIGEVVVGGASVVMNWNDGTPTIPEGGVIKTGDLGFVHQDELYVIDRIKNVIIYNGKNYSASEVEGRIAAILKIEADRVAVFEEAIVGSNPSIILMMDGSRKNNINELSSSIPYLSGLMPPIHRVIIGRRRVIARTSSGKKQYHGCRSRIKDGPHDFLLDITLKSGSCVQKLERDLCHA